MLKTLLLAGSVLAIACAAGCTTTEPHRTSHAVGGIACPADREGRVDRTCEQQIFERSDQDGYELHVVEFDDQGWIPGVDPGHPDHVAHRQLEFVSDCLRELARDSCTQPVSLAVYVHGWKHDASAGDGNARAFRKLLRGLAKVEARDGRKVVGIYVAWRGDSTWLPDPVKSLTFWNRKDAVERVAQGTMRELFARIAALADMANEPWVQQLPRPSCTDVKPVRSLLIGHSFGGHALMTASSSLLLRNLVTLQERDRADSTTLAAKAAVRVDRAAQSARRVELQREGDLIVLVNPAIEGSRFEALHRVAHGIVGTERERLEDVRGYRPPLLVSLTSRADTATGAWFPACRVLGTLFERYGAFVEGDARGANWFALGHNDRYLTHDVVASTRDLPECAGWSTDLPLERQIDMEASLNERFHRELALDPAAALGRRGLCPSWDLVHRDARRFDPTAAIMNIAVPKELVKDHGSIDGEEFVALVRQLYLDSGLHLQGIQRDRRRLGP